MIQIYNDDCLKVVSQLIEQGIMVDCIVTDPPYLVTQKGCVGNTGGMMTTELNKKGKIFEYNDCPVEKWAKPLYSILKDGGHAYIMTNHVNLKNYLNVLEDTGFHFIKSLIWDKGNKIMGRFYMSQFEYILFFRKGFGKQINNCGTPDILSIPNKKSKDWDGNNLHDTEKPVDLMQILIENSTQVGETVLDPFMGSGSTGIACARSNRGFIGIEIDEKYFNVAKSQLEQPHKRRLF